MDETQTPIPQEVLDKPLNETGMVGPFPGQAHKDENLDIVSKEDVQSNNNERRKPPGGFNVNPQNINRNGRPPKNWTWASLLEQAADEMQDVREGNQIVRKPWKKLLVRKLFIKAVKEGDVQAAKIIMDRTDGLPTQDVTSGGEKIDMSPKVVINTNEKYVENS